MYISLLSWSSVVGSFSMCLFSASVITFFFCFSPFFFFIKNKKSIVKTCFPLKSRTTSNHYDKTNKQKTTTTTAAAQRKSFSILFPALSLKCFHIYFVLFSFFLVFIFHNIFFSFSLSVYICMHISKVALIPILM